MKAATIEASRIKPKSRSDLHFQVDSPSGKYYEMKQLVEKSKLTPERLKRLREEHQNNIAPQEESDAGNLQFLFSLLVELEEKDKLIRQLRAELEEKNRRFVCLEKQPT